MRIARPLAERFHEKYIPEPMSGCWLWETTEIRGYGAITIKSRYYRAHRVSYELFVGDIPKGKFVLHKCDTPFCVNPDHLFLGTQADNVADRDNKGRGRGPKGERNGCAKLTEQQILEIRAATGSQREIASQYGIGQPHVSSIKTCRSWSHL